MTAELEHLRGLTQRAGKDLRAEAEWAHLNDLLAPVEAQLARDLTAPKKPMIFILGAPRSGTTLVSQLLAATGAFGVTTNFVARFWRAPGFGFKLESALGPSRNELSFRSVRGRTDGAGEPNEFGYFWSKWFDLGQQTHHLDPPLLAHVDVAGLGRELASMEAAAGKPLLFKNSTWFTAQAGWLAKHFPTGVFLACRRDPYYVAQSIYEQRKALGDVNSWWSIRPASYPFLLDLPALEQVAAQAVDIQREMEDAVSSIPPDRLIEINYPDLCSNPRDLVDAVRRACLADIGREAIQSIPERFASTDKDRLAPADALQLREFVRQRLAQ